MQCLIQSVSKINYTGGEGEGSKGSKDREGGRKRKEEKGREEGRKRRRKGMEREKNRRVRGELGGRRGERVNLQNMAWSPHPSHYHITS